MPWMCPACRLPIRHSDVEAKPRPNTLYRCHVCRLELVLAPDADKLTLPPLPGEAETPKRETA
jgi:hypothetical protein